MFTLHYHNYNYFISDLNGNKETNGKKQQGPGLFSTQGNSLLWLPKYGVEEIPSNNMTNKNKKEKENEENGTNNASQQSVGVTMYI